MANTLKEKLLRAERTIGTMLESCSEMVAEGLGRTGLDYVVIDNEHSPVETDTAARLVRAAEAAGVCPLVRVREISRPAILKMLDVGAKGIVIPNVTCFEDAARVVEYGRFAPVGKRGFCPSRKDGWGFDGEGGVKEQMSALDGDVLIIPQCETVGALSDIEQIAALEGVDGIFLGPYDLSIDMGIPGDFSSPAFRDAERRILAACRKNGKFCICFAGSAEAAEEGFAKGFDSMVFNMDMGVMIAAYRDALRRIRKSR